VNSKNLLDKLILQTTDSKHSNLVNLRNSTKQPHTNMLNDNFTNHFHNADRQIYQVKLKSLNKNKTKLSNDITCGPQHNMINKPKSKYKSRTEVSISTIPTKNRYAPLDNDESYNMQNNPISESRLQVSKQNCIFNSNNEENPPKNTKNVKINIIADSHGRGINKMFTNKIKPRYQYL